MTSSSNVYSVQQLIDAYTALNDRDAAIARLTEQHAQIDNIAKVAKLTKAQVTALRQEQGLSDDLQTDIDALKVDDAIKATLETLSSEPSVTVWQERVKELAPLAAMLETVNGLRELLDVAPMYAAFSAKRPAKRGGKKSTDGEQHTNTRTKYMRPGVLHDLSHKDVAITVTADVDKIVITGGGHTVEHKQGTISVPQMLLSFVKDTLGFSEGTNFSTPSAKLLPAGYHADDVYMLTQPTKDTPTIPQPKRDGEGKIIVPSEAVIGLA